MTGKTLSHYEIQDRLGAGGMGEVYRARDLKLGRSVAVKVLPAAFASDPDRISRFEREAKLLASLNHPNIAALHGMDVFDETHFLVMELIEGETLADRMVRGRIPIDDALGIAHQIAEALEAAHEKGIVHRDLKPANVKIAPDDTVKVLDFGLAKALEQVGEPGPYRGVELSPDERRLAVHRHDGTGGDLWLFERQRPEPLRLTFDASQENSSPMWSPDGKSIAFASLRGGMWGIYQKPADGAGDEQLLFQTKVQIMPKAWSPDGKLIVFWQREAIGDLWTLPLEGERKPQPFLNSRFGESHGQVSPNGKWISYNSNESGRGEIYVRPFPSGPGRWQVSTSGGAFSRWRADGKELYYLTSANRGKLMAIEIKDGSGSFEYGTAKELFDSQYENYSHGTGGNWHTYAVTRDGQRFLIPRPLETAAIATGTSFNVVLNWPSLLTK